MLKYQSVPPILSAYSKFMGGVNRTDHSIVGERTGLIGNLNDSISFNSLTICYQQCLSALQAQLSCSQIECKGFACFKATVVAPALRTSGS